MICMPPPVHVWKGSTLNVTHLKYTTMQCNIRLCGPPNNCLWFWSCFPLPSMWKEGRKQAGSVRGVRVSCEFQIPQEVNCTPRNLWSHANWREERRGEEVPGRPPPKPRSIIQIDAEMLIGWLPLKQPTVWDWRCPMLCFCFCFCLCLCLWPRVCAEWAHGEGRAGGCGCLPLQAHVS